MLTDSFLRLGQDFIIELAYRDLCAHREKTSGWPTMNLKSVFAAMHEKTIRQFAHELSEAHIIFVLLLAHKALRRSVRSKNHTKTEEYFSEEIGMTRQARKLLAEAWITCLVHGVQNKILRSGPEPWTFLVLDRLHEQYHFYVADDTFIDKARDHQHGKLIDMPVPEQHAPVELLDQEYLDYRQHSFFPQVLQSAQDDIRSDTTAVEPLSQNGDDYGSVRLEDVPVLITTPQPERLRCKWHSFDVGDRIFCNAGRRKINEGLAMWLLRRLELKT